MMSLERCAYLWLRTMHVVVVGDGCQCGVRFVAMVVLGTMMVLGGGGV